jgi:uncharacterized repeat protein (TIGR02543 family)
MKTKYLLLFFAMFLLMTPACGGGGGDGGGSSTSTYVVTYDGNGNTGGSVPADSNHYENGQTVTVLGNTGTLVKAGYIFAGWNTQANGSGTTYTAAQTFTIGTANVNLYALWTSESAPIGKWDESTWDNPQWGP